MWLLRRLIPDEPGRIAEDLVWWRVNLAAPTVTTLPLDQTHLEEGPLHHRFAVATFGFVPMDVLHLDIERPSVAERPDGVVDPVVIARTEHDGIVAGEVEAALELAAPSLTGERLVEATALVHALVEGVGAAVCLGRVAPEDAVAILRSQLVHIVQVSEPHFR